MTEAQLHKILEFVFSKLHFTLQNDDYNCILGLWERLLKDCLVYPVIKVGWWVAFSGMGRFMTESGLKNNLCVCTHELYNTP